MVFSVIFVIAVFAFLFYIIPKGKTISSRGTTSKSQAWWPFVAGGNASANSSSYSNFQSGSGNFQSGGASSSGGFGGFGGGRSGGGGASGSW